MRGSISPEMAALAVAGLAIVFTVLALIAAVVALFRRLDDRWQAAEQRAAEAAVERAPTIDDTTLVLIAAACATVVGGRFRVRRIRRLLRPDVHRTPWSAQGRLILQGSHTVDRRRDLR
jgi:Na+-transporting methylmalonyl-CoA/oxaloacetate decarboxylase gamma subunit